MSLHDAQCAVSDFMERAGQHVPTSPCVPDKDTRILRWKLIHEELQEFVVSQAEHDIHGVAKELADLLYVVLGSAVAWGIDIQPIFTEVHASNMSKFIDGYRREDGKFVKGPSYRSPDLHRILEAQMD